MYYLKYGVRSMNMTVFEKQILQFLICDFLNLTEMHKIIEKKRSQETMRRKT